jgi:hypothetical protein
MAMLNGLSEQTLANENRRFFGTGGRSEENAGLGFLPAFRDQGSGMVYRSRFADGRPAPFHLLDGLPDELVAREDSGRVTGARTALVAGFVLGGCFFTREEAAACVSGSLSGVAH